MSDLQCPARFVLVPNAAAKAPDLSGLLARLAGERIAAVYAAADAPVGAAAARLAEQLGMPVRPLPDPGHHPGGCPLPDRLQLLSDSHRGDNVLVVLGPDGWLPGVPRRVDLVRVEVDSDGWRVVSDAGSPVESEES
ncbi:MAG: hypothetical protein IPM08_12185 [Actinomycetales bacterium]|nr:hypothetical protein [Actinomycetales bacterium]